MCDFEDEIKTAVRELAERTFDEHSFKAYLLTVCAYSKTEHEPQGGEPMSAELDGQYKRLRRLGAKLAHKAQWHNERTIPFYVSAVRNAVTE